MNPIRELALDNSRHFDKWPEDDRREAVAAFYAEPSGDIFMDEAATAWVAGCRQVAMLALTMPDREMGQQSLGRSLDTVLMTFAAVSIQHRLDEHYDEWKADALAEKDRDYKGGIR